MGRENKGCCWFSASASPFSLQASPWDPSRPPPLSLLKTTRNFQCNCDIWQERLESCSVAYIPLDTASIYPPRCLSPDHAPSSNQRSLIYLLLVFKCVSASGIQLCLLYGWLRCVASCPPARPPACPSQSSTSL